MIVIVDERDIVKNGYASCFKREGISSTGFCPFDFVDWVKTVSEPDLVAIEAFLIGSCSDRHVIPKLIKGRSAAPVIAMNDNQSLEETLDLFAAGVDDVVRKPMHVKEILARIGAIRGRANGQDSGVVVGQICVFSDGRDPEVGGEVLSLPRRERRILEYLASNRNRRVTKTQIFNSVYGLFDEWIDENVVESHISKLRKKLRRQLGYDPIESKRYLGYQLTCETKSVVASKVPDRIVERAREVALA